MLASEASEICKKATDPGLTAWKNNVDREIQNIESMIERDSKIGYGYLSKDTSIKFQYKEHVLFIAKHFADKGYWLEVVKWGRYYYTIRSIKWKDVLVDRNWKQFFSGCKKPGIYYWEYGGD